MAMSNTSTTPTRRTITKKIMSSRQQGSDTESVSLDDSPTSESIAYSMGDDNQVQVDDSDDAVTITLPSSLDIVVSGDLKEALLYARSMNKKLVLDGSEVDQLSTPAIQLVIAVEQSLTADGIEAVLLNPSAEFASAFDDLGLFSSLMKWKVES